MTDECRIILDEVLTATGNGTAMSAKAAAHLETCSECRRSLEAVKALSTSVVSVLPIENHSALKLRISQKLGASMLARQAAASGTSTSTTAKALVGLGLAATVAIGALCLSSSTNNQAEVKSNQPSPVSTVTSTSSEVTKTSLPSNINQDQAVYQEIFSDGYNGDLRNFEKVKQPTEPVPSATKD